MVFLETEILPPVLPPDVSIWSGQTVDVISGPNVLSLELAGLTVGDVMSLVRDAVNLDSDAHSYVNGQPVEHATVLLPHDRLEFVQAWGRKGGDGEYPILIEVLQKIGDDIRRIANHVDPPSGQVVGTRYVAARLGKTQEWIAKLAQTGKIPASCIVKQSGNGRYWKFHKEKIDQWVEGGNK